MKERISEEELNRLLAQPAQLADNKFSEKLLLKLKESDSLRTNVFTVVVVCCSLFALFAVSPSQIVNTIFMSGISLNSVGVFLMQLLPAQESMALQQISNSSLLGSVFTILLVVAIAEKLSEE